MLQADTFQIRRQIAITCCVINHNGTVHCHCLFSRIPNDSHNFDLTYPVSLSNFHNPSRLSGAKHAFVLINYSLAGRSCQSSKQVIYTHTIKMLWMSMNECGLSWLSCQIFKWTLWDWERDRKKTRKPFGSPAAKPSSLHCPGKQKEVLLVSEDQSCCVRVTSEGNFPWESLYHNDVSVFFWA